MSNPNSQFGKVAVLLGGNSNEREISLNSGHAVLKALQQQGVDAYAFDPAEQNILELQNYDRAFIVLHGRGGEDGKIQGLLDWLNIPYTGSKVLGSAIGMDKARTKQIWMGCGLPTAPYVLMDENTTAEQVVEKLGLPVIVKPIYEGSSIGMSKASTPTELPTSYKIAAGANSTVMAEKWINGQEFTVVILNGQALPVIRLEPPKDVAFYDFEAKYQRNDTIYGIPCGLNKTEEKYLQDIALKAFNAVGASGWGRVDAMQDEQGNFWLLEINTVPGMTDHSLVPKAAQAIGISFNQLCLNILAQTLSTT